VNDDQLGDLIKFGIERPWITGINLQPATYSGRYFLPEQIEQRMTFPDVIQRIEEQTDGMFRQDDFMPLPCAHPNCHSISYAYRANGKATPLLRFIDARNNLDMLSNGICFTRPAARNVMLQYLGRQGCCGGECDSDLVTGGVAAPSLPILDPPAEDLPATSEFFEKVLAQQMGAKDIFRITITSFLDAYNFDVRRLMKCCTHHVLPSGHVIPFCAYNVLYREGHVALPALRSAVSAINS
jgi:uncharacterized radical SAM superfamily Fe-S cluster-containing enzyme